jgi:hypothetical protein
MASISFYCHFFLLRQAQNLYSWATNVDDEDTSIKLSPPTTNTTTSEFFVWFFYWYLIYRLSLCWWWYKVWSFLSSCQVSRILNRYRFCVLASKVWLKKRKRQANRYHCRLLFYRAFNILFYHLYLFFICYFHYIAALTIFLFHRSFTFTLINREYQPLPFPINTHIYEQKIETFI